MGIIPDFIRNIRTDGRESFSCSHQDLRENHPGLLHLFFEATCDALPDVVALECDGRRLSYRELDETANRLAHYLIATGVGQGARIGIFLRRSVETYAAVLAVLKAGVVFVPMDVTWPADRVAFISRDAGLSAVLTTSTFRDITADLHCPVLEMDTLSTPIGSSPASRLPCEDTGDRPCYVIYTSGSTGRPKGVEISQASICNFIGVVPALYGVRPGDRVYQGMTIAFDFSIEEIWPTWAVGGTVVAGPTDTRRLGTGLAEFLIDSAISVLCCVPTLLATIDRDVSSVRTLIVGGEACPAELVGRWSRPGRRILNTYGPTETTVTATCGELAAGRPVTIGRPLPTYRVYVLDDELRRVPAGACGEICIGGPGLARGYLGRPELTASRFIPRPFAGEDRIYRTGDLGRLLPTGEIDFLGRADTEVKIRGHRVELGEIERVLLEDEAVKQAVAALVPAPGSSGELAVYVTPRTVGNEDALRTRLHDRLRRQLPAYMTPTFMEVLATLPTLASGKVDRNSLPHPTSRRVRSTAGPPVPAATPLEREIAAAWADAFSLPSGQMSVDDDFFLDLGGHSLLAAAVVSTLRRGGSGVAIADLYAHPTIKGLAGHLQAAAGDRAAGQHRGAVDSPIDGNIPAQRAHRGGKVTLCGSAQLALVYLWLLVVSGPEAFVFGMDEKKPFTVSTVGLLAWVIPTTLIFGVAVLPVLIIRLLSWRLRPGRYPLWGATFIRVWAVQKILSMSPLGMLSGSPMMALYLRLLGARVGRHCHIATEAVSLPVLTMIGAGASIGYGAELHGWVVEDGWVTIKPVEVGADAFVGANTALLPGARLGASARLAEQSLLAEDQAVPDRASWAGSPSGPCRGTDPLLDAMADNDAGKQWSCRLIGGFLLGLVALILLPFLMLVPALLMVLLTDEFDGFAAGLAVTLLAGPVFVVTACLIVACGKRLALRSTPTGIHPLMSSLGLRKWFTDKLMLVSLFATNSLYATLYTSPWLRILGARVGPRAEVSTVSHLDPDLLSLGPESFVADLASVGSARYYRGNVAFGRTNVGRRSFIGNAALVPAGVKLGEGSLVGVHTTPPPDGVPDGTSWLGSPPIFLPRRQRSDGFGEELTYRPARRRVVERLLIEFFRVTLPATVLSATGFAILVAETSLSEIAPPLVILMVTPAVLLLGGLCAVLAVAALKWLIVGRYRPRAEGLWSLFVRRTELVTGLYESAAVPALLLTLTGTPLLGPLLRLFGARIGRRTFLDTTRMTEFDLVHVGDDAVVGARSSLQTHLFEDRVMKMSVVTIARHATVGPRSIVLYDAEIGDGSTLDALSLVMKGEQLPAGTGWRGIPCQPAGRNAAAREDRVPDPPRRGRQNAYVCPRRADRREDAAGEGLPPTSLTKTPGNELRVGVDSEVGALRDVIVHRPGLELDRLTASNVAEYLFDDTPRVARARAEHDAFVDALRDHDVTVHLFDQLLAEAVATPDGREFALDRTCIARRFSPALTKQVRALLDDSEPATLAKYLIGGVTTSDLSPLRRESPSRQTQNDDVLLLPLPNTLFQRDTATWISHGVNINPMAKAARQRESINTRTVCRYHPLFRGIDFPIYNGDDDDHRSVHQAPATLEGGDIHVIAPGVVLIGIGGRSSLMGAEILARRLFAADQARLILAVEMPRSRLLLHLDTLLTMVDTATFVGSPCLEWGQVRCWWLSPRDSQPAGVTMEHRRGLPAALAEALRVDTVRVLVADREQRAAEQARWDSENYLAVAPGVVIGYEHNVVTNTMLRGRGIEVITVAGSELRHGRGGPRCMSCPVHRAPQGLGTVVVGRL